MTTIFLYVHTGNMLFGILNLVNKKIYSLIAFFGKYGFRVEHVLMFLFFVLNIIIFFTSYKFYFAIWAYLVLILLLLLPFALFVFLSKKLYSTWIVYKRRKFIASEKKVLLEIILPPDCTKGPKAMEAFFSSIHIAPGEGTFIDLYLKGSTRPWWSFELVSAEGELHFYIWTWAKFKDMIITQMKANFPNIELVEVDDYLDGLQPDLNKIEIWGTDYTFTNHDVYPIMSYIDWGLDKIQERKGAEQSIVDPLDTVFEKFSSLGEGEVAILHIMVQVTRNKKWKKEVEKEIDRIYQMRTTEYPDITDPEKTVQGWAQLRPQDYDIVNILKHSIEKDAYDVAIRSVYLARKDKFNPKRIGINHVHLFRAFEVPHLNYPIGIANWLAGYDYPWQDPFKKERTAKKIKIIDALRRRQYFHVPYNLTTSTPAMIMTTEELATIYHFPINVNKYINKNTHKVSPPKNLPT